MKKTLIIYESHYGFTDYISKIMAMILGPSRYCRTNEFKEEYKSFDFFVIISPVYSDKLDNKILDFVYKNQVWLKQKRVAVLCTCLSTKTADMYLEPIYKILDKCLVWSAAIGGRLDIKKLNNQDFNSIKRFSDKTGYTLKSVDLFDMEKLVEYTMAIKLLKDEVLISVPKDKLKSYIYDFIKKHNTCTLSTGYGKNVRGTPIEYNLIDDCIYILSEGGEKFANILLNDNIAISIYDPYEGMEKLGGLQIKGKATIIDMNSFEYKKIIEEKGLNYDKICSLSIIMNLIKISLSKAEFLWSGFSKIEVDSKQIIQLL